jgi:ferric-dicitrate binding protein FerR (iron transport regulator)
LPKIFLSATFLLTKDTGYFGFRHHNYENKKMENYESIHLLILRLFSGEADIHEKQKIAEWLELSPDNKKLYLDLREIWLGTGVQSNADQYQLEAAIEQFREHISQVPRRLPGASGVIQFIRKYAALFVLAFTLPIGYYLGTPKYTAQSMTTVCCALGDKTNIILPDSTRVWLNSGSRLSFNSDFKSGGRNVQLEGEAYFSVSKDKEHPFTVKTAEIEIRVLGTQFNVKAYPEEKSVSTTLIEGSIQISSPIEKMIIAPDQKMVFSKETQKMSLNRLTDTAPEIDWKRGRLIFRNESLEELEVKLERWFDVDIFLADEQVKHRRFTGTLERESILEVISYFDLSKYVTCNIQGNKIIIKTKTR